LASSKSPDQKYFTITLMASQSPSSYGDNLDLLGRVPTSLPFRIEREIPAKALTAELHRKTLALSKRALNIFFRCPTLLHSIAGVRVNPH